MQTCLYKPKITCLCPSKGTNTCLRTPCLKKFRSSRCRLILFNAITKDFLSCRNHGRRGDFPLLCLSLSASLQVLITIIFFKFPACLQHGGSRSAGSAIGYPICMRRCLRARDQLSSFLRTKTVAYAKWEPRHLSPKLLKDAKEVYIKFWTMRIKCMLPCIKFQPRHYLL